MRGLVESRDGGGADPGGRVRSAGLRRRTGILLALLALVALGVALRWAGARSLGFSDDGPFWAESAQHFRYFSLVARGEGIPALDRRIQVPDPFDTRSQTLLQEQLTGLLARWSGLDDRHWPVFLRWYVRLLSALIVVPAWLLARRLGVGPWASLAAAAIYACSPAVVIRAAGDSFYHEHTALLFLGLTFAWGLRALETGRRAPAVGAGLSLLAGLLTWKLVRYVHLELVLLFALLYLAGRSSRGSRRLLAALTLLPAAASLLPGTWLSWSRERYLLAPPMLLSYALLALLARSPSPRESAARRPGLRARALRLLAAIGLAAILSVALGPGEQPYAHVWSLLRARLTHWTKPADPLALDFEARHYWVPPYTTPFLIDFLEEAALLLLLAAPGLAATLRRLRAGPPHPAGDNHGPDREVMLALIFLFLTGLGGYLLFQKLAPLMVLCIAPFIALLPAALAARFPRRGRTAGALLLVGMLALQAHQVLAWPESVVTRALGGLGIKDPPEKLSARVATSTRINRVLAWLATKTPTSAVVLSEFTLAPVILTYANRATNQHAYFESGFRERYRAFVEALFADEETLYRLCREWKTNYLVYNAHMLLRTDPNMSFRYVAAKMEFDWNWVATQLHFRPERLKHFDLMYQNDFFRIYRVLAPGERKSGNDSTYEALFDEKLFREHVPRDPAGRPLTGDWIYPFVTATEHFERAFAAMKEPFHDERLPRFVEQELDLAVKATPLIAKVHTLRGMFYYRRKRFEDAREALRRALQLDPADERAAVLLRRVEARLLTPT
jgi:hypothetical protein